MTSSRKARARIFCAQLVAMLVVALGLALVGGTAPASAAPPANNCQTTGDGWVKPSDSASGTVNAAFGSLSWNGNASGDAKTQVSYTLKAGFTLELCVKAGQGDYYSPVITVPAGQAQVSGVYDTDDQYGVSHIAYRVRAVLPARPSYSDPCGAGNATWDVPADTAGIDWRLENGNLTAYAIAPYKFTDGTSSVAFGKAPESGTSCVTPVTVDVTFTDNACVDNTYVAPTMNAPAVAGTSKDVTGNVAPGSTVTVTYTALDGYTITGQSAFSHTFPALPSSAAYCDRPTDEVVHDAQEGCDLSAYGDFEAGVIRRTGVREYVWNAHQDRWVLEPESGTSWNAWTQSAGDVYGDQQYFTTCAPAEPEPVTVDDSKDGCDLSQYGDFEAGVIRRTGEQEYVWNAQTRAWELEPASGISWGPWTQGAGDVYTDQEYFEACAPGQPTPKAVTDTDEGCDLSAYGDFEAGVIRRTGAQEYLWNAQTRAWELEPAAAISWGPWTQVAGDVYGDDEFFTECAPDQPAAEEVRDSQEGCDLSTYGDFEAGVIRRTGLQDYVWNGQTRAWELEDDALVSWGPWTQVAGDVYGDDAYFAECAPEKPKDVTTTQEKPGCDLTYYGEFEPGVIEREGVQAYLWNPYTRTWELGQVAWGPWTQSSTYSDEEYFELCAPGQPEAEPLSDTASGCDLSQYGDFEAGVIGRSGEQPYVWDAATRTWVLGEEVWGEWTQSSTYSDEEYFELCAPGQPEAEPLSDTASGCDLSQYGDFEAGVIGRSGEQPYVWDAATRTWVLGEEVWGEWTQSSTYSDEEYFELCAPGQPEAEPLSDTASGCDLSQYGDFEAGVIGRSGEQPYVWDAATRTWVLGEEVWGEWTQSSTYSDEEYFELCATGQPDPVVREVAGVQASCALGGVSSWVDTYTTAYVWNAETRTWELGEETGPVRSDEQFQDYTAAQLERLCTDVKGDQGETIAHELPAIEVKGEQAEVPTEVAAGDAGVLAPLGVVHRNPLWLLVLGGGLGLMGLAGSRRWRTANR